MKFIASNYKSKLYAGKEIRTINSIDINDDLNKINFDNLFNQQDY